MAESNPITPDLWRDFIDHPGTKALVLEVEARIKMSLVQLESGLEDRETIPYEDLRFIQGECKSLRWLQAVLTSYEEVLKEKEKLEEQKDGES